MKTKELEQLVYKYIDQLDDDYQTREFMKFIFRHKIEWDYKKNDWSRSYHMVTKNVWVDDKNNEYMDADGNKKFGYYQTQFVKWKLGQDTHKFEKCTYCFRELKGKQRRYCSDKCRILAKYIRDKADKLNSKLIVHSEKRKKGKLFFPQWKDFVVHSQDGKKKPLTKKKGHLKEIIEKDFMGIN